jgi:hypothetical protein
MGAMAASAWVQTMRVYEETFSTPVPRWLKSIELHRRLHMVRVAICLRWRLPQEWLLGGEKGGPL